MRSVKVKAIIVNALNYTFQKGLLLHSKRGPFAFQNESFCSPKRVLLQAKRSPFEKPLFFPCKSIVFPLFYPTFRVKRLEVQFSYDLAMQIVGGYGVPAIA